MSDPVDHPAHYTAHPLLKVLMKDVILAQREAGFAEGQLFGAVSIINRLMEAGKPFGASTAPTKAQLLLWENCLDDARFFLSNRKRLTDM